MLPESSKVGVGNRAVLVLLRVLKQEEKRGYTETNGKQTEEGVNRAQEGGSGGGVGVALC